MDMDFLKPGTVPISKDNVTWFDIVLNPKILEIHLNKEKPGECKPTF